MNIKISHNYLFVEPVPVRIPQETWTFFCCECCVLSGRGLCDGLITCSEESYQLWCVVECDQETSKTRRLKRVTGLWKYNQSVVTPGKQTNTLFVEALVLQPQQISTSCKHGRENITTPKSMKITVICNVPPCSLLGVYWQFWNLIVYIYMAEE